MLDHLIQEGFSGTYFLTEVLLPVCAWAVGVWIEKSSGKRFFRNKRIYKRVGFCFSLGIVSFLFHFHIITWIVFTGLVFMSAFWPAPHELILLRFSKNLYEGRPSLWIVTIPAKLAYNKHKIGRAKNVKGQQLLTLEFFKEVRIKKWGLFEWEIKKYYLPRLDVYIHIGAFSKLKSELDRLVDFKDTYMYKQLLLFYYDGICDYQNMKKVMAEINDMTEEDSISERTIVVIHINNMAVAEKNGEEEKEAAAVTVLEEDYKKNKYQEPILCSNLMQYYESHNMWDKADKLAQDIEQYSPSIFKSYIDIKDIAFMHYRRESNFEKLHAMLDDFIKANEKMQDGEEKMITQIRMMCVFFENQYKWQEYSNFIFCNHNNYLEKSWRVGVELIKETLRLEREAWSMYQVSLGGLKAKEMFDDFDKHVNPYIQSIDEEIDLLPDEMVYSYKVLLLDKLELLTLMYQNNLMSLTEAKIDIYKRILERCRQYGNIREYCFNLNSYIDEIFESDRQIEDLHSKDPNQAEKLGYTEYKKYQKVYFKDAIKKIEYLDEFFKGKDNDKSLAYFILWDSYYHYLLKDDERALSYYRRFRKMGVDYHSFTMPAQKIYGELTVNVADEPYRIDSPDGKVCYVNLKG